MFSGPRSIVDRLTRDRRSRLMAAVRGTNTVPEIVVRRVVHGMGFRYRLHDAHLRGKPDLVFPRLRAIILVHGCFWHGHTCRWGRTPKSNQGFWDDKRATNRKRDKRVIAAWRRDGWRVLVVWGCQVRDSEGLKSRLLAFFEGRPSNISLSRLRPMAANEIKN